MRISVINLTHGLLSDTEVIIAIRAINRQIKEDFEPYWNMQGQLRLEGNSSTDQPDIDHPEDMQGEAIIYLWDKADVPNALGYHDANYRGIPYGFVFVDIATEIGENWTVTFSHEALELIGDRQAGKLIRGPHPSEKNRTVYHWHEMCDAVQNETYEIDGIEVSNFVLPLYFTEDAEPGSRNDFLGTQYFSGSDPNKTSLASFGINPGGYIGYFDHINNQHETELGPDLNAAGIVGSSKDTAHWRQQRKNKARLLRRGNRYVEMGRHVVKSPQRIAAKKKQKLHIGERELTIKCATDALTVQTDVALLSAKTGQRSGYFAYDIYADENKIAEELQRDDFEEIAALQIEPVIQPTLSSPPKVEIGIKHSKDEAVIALVEVDGVIFWQQPDKTSRGSAIFNVTVQAVEDNARSRRGFLIKGAKTLVRIIRHKIVDEVKERVMHHLNDYLAEAVEDLAFQKSKSATLDQIKLLKNPTNKTIGIIKKVTKKLPGNKKYLVLIHGIFSSTKGAFSELLLNRWDDNLLKKLDKEYHQIISFDHWTVAHSTLENATELLAKLPKNCEIDIICHSRGAGVTRCLLEHPELAPKLSRRGIKVGKVVFVAGACQGSALASPDKIGTLVNVFSALSSVSGSYIPIALFTGLLKAVQYGVNNFPGIASMAPDSPLFTELNKPINQDDCEYIYTRSNYEPSGKLKQMFDELALDKFIFENEENDGVVPFKGAGTFDDSVNDTITVTAGPEYGIEQKEHVFHTVLLEQQQVRQALINHLTK